MLIRFFLFLWNNTLSLVQPFVKMKYDLSTQEEFTLSECANMCVGVLEGGGSKNGAKT